MKSKFFKTVLLAAVIVSGIWILSNRDQIRNPNDVLNLVGEGIAWPKFGFASSEKSWTDNETAQQKPQFATNVVRVAYFKLNRRSDGRPSEPEVNLLADICRRYDVIALQEIDAKDTNWLVRLTNRINTVAVDSSTVGQSETRFQPDYYFVADRLSQDSKSTNLSSENGQSAIVFNRRTIELGQSGRYTINDPDGVLSYQPLVACFRTRGPAVDQAFTFTLVNVKTGGDRQGRESAHLGELFRAIRDDGRGEDDVLIVGDFHSDDHQDMWTEDGLISVVANRPNQTLVGGQFSNLIFNELATIESTGRGGVFDFMRFYNLRLAESVKISKQMPAWAEFSVFEGAAMRRTQDQSKTPGRVAEGESPTSPR